MQANAQTRVSVQVKPRSLSDRFGLRPGDAVVQIGHVPATHLNHDHAKAEILRAGNDLHLIVRRFALRIFYMLYKGSPPPPPPPQTPFMCLSRFQGFIEVFAPRG